MKVDEMRELSEDEIKTQIADTRKELVDLRFQLALRKLESPARLKTSRKKLAQLLTIAGEKASGGQGGGSTRGKSKAGGKAAAKKAKADVAAPDPAKAAKPAKTAAKAKTGRSKAAEKSAEQENE